MRIKIKSLSIIIIFSVLITSVEAGNEEIQRLIEQGTYSIALVLAEEQLSKNPDEVQTLFLKGVILAIMERPNDAAAVFVGLTERHPELPEPYNNLAVIYAASGDYDKAEEALLKAINTHPSYATAHENLGDIYAIMASQAYNIALRLDANNAQTKEKLSMISDLILAPGSVAVTNKTEAMQPDSKSHAQVDTNLTIAKSKPEIEPESTLAIFEPEPTTILEPPFDQEAVHKEVISDLILAPGSVAVANKTEAMQPDSKSHAQVDINPTIAKSKPEIEPEPTLAIFEPEPTTILEPPFDQEAVRKEVKTAVNSWAGAWSAKNVSNYVNSYSAKFVPPNKLSRSQWEEQRRVRLNKPKFIKVFLDNVKIEILSQEMTLVRFVQTYQSDYYKDQVNKQLLLNKIDGTWLISKEESN